MVVDERLNNLHLHHIFNQQWKETDFKDQYLLIQLEIQREAASPALFEFLLQDHTPFWNYVNNDSSYPLPAILITDTGKFYKSSDQTFHAFTNQPTRIFNVVQVNGEEWGWTAGQNYAKLIALLRLSDLKCSTNLSLRLGV